MRLKNNASKYKSPEEGFKLSAKLKDVRSDVPVIICTGHNSLIDEEKAKHLGIDAYVMKPIVKQEIV